MGEWTKLGSVDVGSIYFKNASQNAQLYLGLFTNDYLGDLNDLTFALIVEPIATTYARAPLNPANWMQSGELLIHPVVEFEVSLEPLGIIYGAFIATSLYNSGRLVAAQKFTSPYDLLYYGDLLEITPKIMIT